MRRRLSRRRDEADINVTPMLDVVFIMLIFFIVTTSFVVEYGVDVNRPMNSPPELQDADEVIAVRIDENDRIYVEDRLVDVRAVRANIETGLALQPDAAVIVISDRLSDAGLLVRVVDQARVAGASRVSLAAQSQ